MSLYSINDPKHWLDRAKEARALAEQMNDPEAKRTMLKNADITSGSPKERENEQQDAGQSQSSCSIREIARELAAMDYTNKPARAVFGVMRPKMQVSVHPDCDALPATGRGSWCPCGTAAATSRCPRGARQYRRVMLVSLKCCFSVLLRWFAKLLRALALILCHALLAAPLHQRWD